ncbi:hypothetical protein GGR56DRAFT_48822 [Xylariaceae sp. FL0804]|nr:hypothetical protein GGR56DRAFT_48822 [Xylariaceae sp. FL0804]
MPSRLQKARASISRRGLPKASRSDIANDSAYLYAASDADIKTKLAPPSTGAPNTMNYHRASHDISYNHSPTSAPSVPAGQPISTIRTVPSFEAPSLASSSEPPSARNSGFSSSVRSNVSGVSYVSQYPPMQNGLAVRLKLSSPDLSLDRSRSGGSQMSSSDITQKAREIESTLSPLSPDSEAVVYQSAREDSPQWDSAVGKAGLGKTGRVINKLVSDNEALKREIKLEKLKAEESKQAAKLVEDKLERMAADYESRLLEANVNKTLLSRKERQVEHLQSTVETEKKRTADAQAREQTWRTEMEKSRRDTKVQIEEANSHAALMEGRYNAISSHWKDQGQEVKRSVTKMNGRIQTLVEEREQDDDKINVLRDLCDQQDSNIQDLRKQKEAMSQQFEAYKRDQEAALADIKRRAQEREEEQTKTIEETKEVLGQLKWALQVKQNVKDAR